MFALLIQDLIENVAEMNKEKITPGTPPILMMPIFD
jgi:hypothetical protein